MDLKEYKRKQISKEIFIPFGIEIEAEGIPYDNSKRVINHKVDDKWSIKTDRSLQDGGVEIVSPVLTNDIVVWKQLRKLSETLKFLSPTFDQSSFQVNLDAFNLSEEEIIDFLKLYSVYEKVIYGFSKGFDQHLRKDMSYAEPISYEFYQQYHKKPRFRCYHEFINNKRFSISLKTKTRSIHDKIQVIEFRTPNGTDDAFLWQNYITCFSAMLKHITSRMFDPEKIDFLFSKCFYRPSLDSLETVDEKKGIEFAELIFTNDMDKTCFYKQYLH